MYVIPAANPLAGEPGQPARLKIRDPDRKDFLPDDGREVPSSEYWTRRLRDKDVALQSSSAKVASTSKTAE